MSQGMTELSFGESRGTNSKAHFHLQGNGSGGDVVHTGCWVVFNLYSEDYIMGRADWLVMGVSDDTLRAISGAQEVRSGIQDSG